MCVCADVQKWIDLHVGATGICLCTLARGCAPWPGSSSPELRRLSTQRWGRCSMQMRGCGEHCALGPRKRGEAPYKKSTEDISLSTTAKAPETRVCAVASAASRAATSETTAAGARAGRRQGAGTLRARRGSAQRSLGPLPGALSQFLRSVSPLAVPRSPALLEGAAASR